NALKHSAYLAVDLNYVIPGDQFDLVAPGPGGQHFGMWKVKGTGAISLQNVSGATIEPTKAMDTSQCPGNDPAKWESISWVADLGKMQGQTVAVHRDKGRAYLELTQGTFGAVMPSDAGARGQKFVIVDQNDQDVLNGGNQIIDQPLAAAVFYRAKVLGDYAMVTMPNGTVIKIKGVSTGGLQVLFSHL